MVCDRFGSELPFLFKVLAAAEPLSIQAHPSQEQARAGWQRENESGIPVDAPHRNYRDPNHKPELVCALTPFVALEGFRARAEIVRNLRSLGMLAAGGARSTGSRTRTTPPRCGRCSRGLLTLDADESAAVLAPGRGRDATPPATRPGAGWDVCSRGTRATSGRSRRCTSTS